MFNARESCRLTSSTTQASRFRLSAITGVAVRRLIEPSQGGASPSSTKINASREGTSNVGFKDVVIAMMAPRVTRVAAPHGKYFIATSDIGVGLALISASGKTPNATTDIKTKIKAVALIPRRNTSGSR